MKFLLVALLVFASNSIAPCYGQSDINVGSSELHEFNNLFSNFSQYHLESKSCTYKEKFSFMYDELISCNTYSFQSKQAIQQLINGKKFFNKFKISVYSYGQNEISESKFYLLYDSAHSDMGLSYTWDYIIILDKKLYWLNAGCLYSDKSWENIKMSLKSALSISSTGGTLITNFSCLCGSGCKM